MTWLDLMKLYPQPVARAERWRAAWSILPIPRQKEAVSREA